VYNKGENTAFEQKNVLEIIPIENVGKCDHTYLYHIIQHYEKLTNIVVFFPGSMNIDYKKKRAIQILHHIVQSNYTKACFVGFYHKNLKEHYQDFHLEEWKNSDSNNFMKNSETKLQLAKIRPYGRWYTYFFGNIVAHWSTYWGIFSFDKRDILQHPVTRYQILLETINKHPCPEAAHYIERSWAAIFYPLLYTEKIRCD
jgi:hypothetical protein